MNRRDFLGLFRGLAVLPFVKLPELPAVPATPIEAEVEEGLPVYDPPFRLGHYVPGSTLNSGQAVYLNHCTGKLDVWNGDGQIVGVAARDIAPGEVIEWRIGGNSKDTVTSGVAKIKVIDSQHNL